MVVLRPVLLLLAAVLLVPAVDAAPYEGVDFTEVWTDLADNAGMVDMTGLAIGEPGDGTFVLRFTVADFTVSTPADRVHAFFTAPNGAFGPGFDPTGAPSTFVSGTDPTAYGDATPDSCQVDGSTVFCAVNYTKVGATVGSALTATYGVSYRQIAQDYAPGAGGFVPASLVGERGADYTITGCTKAGGCAKPVTGGPKTIVSNLTGAAAAIKASYATATNDTYVYRWTAPASALEGHANVTVRAGRAVLTVKDAAGATVWSETFTATRNATKAIPATPGGKWNITVAYTGFTGAVDIGLAVASTSTTTSTSATTTTTGAGPSPTTGADGSSTSEQAGGEEETPGWPLLLAIATVALAAAVRRRLP